MQGQLATYKEMAAAAEADRSRLEQEVLATAQLATSLEARLRTALAARDGAEARIAAAEMKAYEVRRLPCQVMCPLKSKGPVLFKQRLGTYDVIGLRSMCQKATLDCRNYGYDWGHL